jgi:cellulose synthase/poly-beta-1,6-N-acetylglucosamine synthase-like glycosyltransferase
MALTIKSLLSRKKRELNKSNETPLVSILVTVHNEDQQIRERIDNLMNLEFPKESFEILIASDASTDQTDDIVNSYGDKHIRLFRVPRQFGKTATQNLAIKQAKGNIVVFTDASTRFDRLFLKFIIEPFCDSSIGAVDGHLFFINKTGSKVSESQGYYWRYELSLREAESSLGILAVSSGACMAARKHLLIEMDSNTGEDCIIPLDIIKQGYRVVHVSNALAYDHTEISSGNEFRARTRMTLRNWQGTWSRPELLNPLHYPGIAFALWSHKLLRWLSPLFLIGLIVSANLSALSGNDLNSYIFAFGVNGFLLLAAIEWITKGFALRIPGAGIAYSFMLANAGFLVGIIRSLIGQKVNIYRGSK